MLPSNEKGSRKKNCTTGCKTNLQCCQYKGSFASEMKVAEGHYVMVVRSLRLEKTEEVEKRKIVILERVQSLLAEFNELVHDDQPDSLPPMRDIQYHIDLVLRASLTNRPYY